MEQVTMPAAAQGVDECKKVIDLVADFAGKLANVDWKKLSAEVQDFDDEEKKELLVITAKKLLSGLLVVISA
jgi:hypothetical protein